MRNLFKKAPAAASAPSPLLDAVQAQIATRGFAVIRAALPRADIEAVRRAATAFYDLAERSTAPRFPRAYLYNPGNMAVSMTALDDFGTTDYPLVRAVAGSPVAACLRHYLGDEVLCSLTHSRLRKSYAQSVAGRQLPSTVAWHTDGGPNVGYFGAFILWVPFTPCNDRYPGLEFQLADGGLLRPELDLGDALLFGDRQLHRTAVCPTSTEDRYSCDMRFFRASDIPHGVHKKIAQEPLLSLSAFAATFSEEASR